MTYKMFKAAGWAAVGCLVVMIAAAPAQTQSRLRVTIPFAFEAGGDFLPAGVYVIEGSAQAGSPMLQIHNADQNRTIAVMTTPAGLSSGALNPWVKFEILAGDYRLAEVRAPGREAGVKLPRTKEQALIAKQAGNVRTGELALSLVR